MKRVIATLLMLLMLGVSHIPIVQAFNGIVFTYKAGLWSTTNTAASYTATPTWTPVANSLLLCFVVTTYSASPTDPSAVSGHGQSYTKLTLGTSTLSTTHKLSAWVALAGGSPTSAACVATVTTTNGTGGAVIEVEVQGADVSGTAANAIVASSATNNATSTSRSVTFASPGLSGNRPIMFAVQLSNAAQSQSGSWTIGHGATPNFNTPATGASTAWRQDTFNTAGAMTGANVAWRAVGLEVRSVRQPGLLLGNLRNRIIGFCR